MAVAEECGLALEAGLVTRTWVTICPGRGKDCSGVAVVVVPVAARGMPALKRTTGQGWW